MRKTLLLVFIHGFKGGDDTFDQFPDNLRALVSHALPNINVTSIVYPRFETRGDLKDSVKAFREWLQDHVIDIETTTGTKSPTLDATVRVVLVGHSMGGIVAAETLIAIANDAAESQPTDQTGEKDAQSRKAAENIVHPLFPSIQGVLAFDTPYLGVHPGVFAHTAEQHFNTASTAVSVYNTVVQFFGSGEKAQSAMAAAAAASTAAVSAGGAEAVTGKGRLGKYALLAGGAAALAAAGGAAYYKKSQITSGMNWISSHLIFVGCLMRGAELGQRVDQVVKVSEKYKLGFADIYTRLSPKDGRTLVAEKLVGSDRTFCVVPEAKRSVADDDEEPRAKRRKPNTDVEQSNKGCWIEAINTTADDEITAHQTMFTPRQHPGYYTMRDKARDLIVSWVDQAWYESSDKAASTRKSSNASNESVTLI